MPLSRSERLRSSLDLPDSSTVKDRDPPKLDRGATPTRRSRSAGPCRFRSEVAMIKVLFLAANPVGTTFLAHDEEARAIDARIRASAHPDLIQLVTRWAVRLDDLSGHLMRECPDIVHFSGHGEP